MLRDDAVVGFYIDLNGNRRTLLGTTIRKGKPVSFARTRTAIRYDLDDNGKDKYKFIVEVSELEGWSMLQMGTETLAKKLTSLGYKGSALGTTS